MRSFKLKLIVSLFFTFCCTLAFAQTNNRIQITGIIDTSIINKYHISEVHINLYPSFIQDCESLSFSKTVPVKPNGHFEIILSDIQNEQCYISFALLNDGGNKRLPKEVPFRGKWVSLHRTDVYPINKGDSLSVKVQNDNYIHFEGRGAEKLQCQEQILNCSAINMQTEFYRYHDLGRLINVNNARKATVLEDRWLELQVEMGKAILESYRGQFSESEMRRFYADLIASVYFEKITTLSWAFNFANSESTVPENKYFLNDFLSKPILLDTDSNILASSAYYADLIYQLEIDKLKFSDAQKKNEYGDLIAVPYSFGTLYEVFKERYSGKLRDKLINIAFQNASKQQMEAVLFIDDALKSVKDPYFHQCLQNWKTLNNRAFSFSLKDVNGKKYSLNDFKGKLLVLDFWFNGCVHCTELNAFMQPIFARYKNNSDIQFLSVNVDRDDEVWKKGIATKLYTTPDELLLKVGNLGPHDPFLLAYNYDSFPQLMIIGKNGSLVTSNAPQVGQKFKPGEGVKRGKYGNIIVNEKEVLENENTQEFIKLIDKNLKGK